MSYAAELANAARWISARVERLPEADRPDVAAAWDELLRSIENTRSKGSAELAIIEWRRDMATKLEAG